MAEAFGSMAPRSSSRVYDAASAAAQWLIDNVGPFVPPELRGKVRAVGEVANMVNPATSLRDYTAAAKQGHYGEAAANAFGLVPGEALAAGAAKLAAIPLLPAVAKGIRAYHGSPHDFDRFDISKIGTGEGAQSYGHGLYFAESEPVARSYRNKLSPIKPITTDAGTFDQAAILQALDREENAMFAAAKRLGGWDKAIAQVQQQRAAAGSAETRAAADRLIAAADRVKGQIPIEPAGRMYEVNINARPEQFLDWDKPLSTQPHVADALIDASKNPRFERRRQEQWRRPSWGEGDPNASYREAVKGSTAYEALAGDLGAWDATSAALKDRGIPGIRYLDQGSRFNPTILPDNPIANEAREFLRAANGDATAALKAFGDSNPVTRWGSSERDEIRKVIEAGVRQPTSNYVVFDDGLIDILRKYGLAGIPAAGVAGAALSDREPTFGTLAP